MSFETSLFNRLSSALSATVGSRIYPVVAKKGAATPYIVYSKTGTNKQYSHDGSSSLTADTIRISVYSTGYLSAKTVVDSVVTAMESWTDAQAAFKETEFDLYDDNTKLFSVPLDYLVWHGG